MSGFIDKMLNRVVVLKLANIDSSMSNYINKAINDAKNTRVEAIIVTLNSVGKSVTEAKNISETLKRFSFSKKAPLYCFAEDACLGSATIVLTAGLKCYINKFTLLGQLRTTGMFSHFQKLGEKLNIKHEFVANSHNDLNVDSFKADSQKSRKFMSEYITIAQNELKTQILRNRADAIKLSEMSSNQVENTIFGNIFVDTNKAEKCGLVDGIKSVDEFMQERYGDTKKKVYQLDEYRRVRALFQY